MRKTILIFCLVASTILILEGFDTFNALLLFVLAGIVPGTTVSIPYYGMLALMSLGILLVVWRISRSKDVQKFIRRSNQTIASHKKSLPKRRFSEI